MTSPWWLLIAGASIHELVTGLRLLGHRTQFGRQTLIPGMRGEAIVAVFASSLILAIVSEIVRRSGNGILGLAVLSGWALFMRRYFDRGNNDFWKNYFDEQQAKRSERDS